MRQFGFLVGISVHINNFVLELTVMSFADVVRESYTRRHVVPTFRPIRGHHYYYSNTNTLADRIYKFIWRWKWNDPAYPFSFNVASNRCFCSLDSCYQHYGWRVPEWSDPIANSFWRPDCQSDGFCVCS